MSRLLTILPLIVAAAAADPIDQYISTEMKGQHIPGLALGIYRRGEAVRVQGYGLSNVELDVPVKPATIFQSGSVGKQFAATAVMMLVEEGKVNLDDSITRYFDRAPAKWEPVKVKNLLSHTSGIAEYETIERIKPGAPFYLRLDFTEDELFDKVAAMPMDFQPGEKWKYRNTNYLLLGMMIRKVTGQFYGDFLADRIFKPLGMTSTRIISEEDIIPNRASGYRLVKGELKNQEWVSPTFNSTADGAIYFNVLDLARWDAALYTEKLLKKSSLDRMWTRFLLNDGKPNPGNYGFAWSIDEINGHRVIQHGGAWQGFTTFIARYVEDGITVVVLTNLDSAHSQPGKIAHAVAGLYDPQLTPPRAKAVEGADPQVTTVARKTIRTTLAIPLTRVSVERVLESLLGN
jgi:CubicO group peptidase (beta-lactamase class C family)